jgi:hypothetical protein
MKRLLRCCLASTTFLAMSLVGVIAFLAPQEGRADSMSFNFAGTLQSAVNGTTSITGTFSLDSATGNMTSYQFADGSFTYTPVNSAVFAVNPGGEIFYVISTSICTGDVGSSCAFLALDFLSSANFSSLTFQAPFGPIFGSAACSGTITVVTGPSNCGAVSGSSLSPFASGSVTPVTAASEPTSLLLLGSGLLGLALFRRRFANFRI